MIDESTPESREINAIDKYLEEKKLLEEKRKKLGDISLFSKFPYLNQVFGILMIIVFLVGFIALAPYATGYMEDTWLKQDSAKRNMFTVSIIFNMFFLALYGIIMLFAGRIMRLWIMAWITKKPLTAIFTDNRTLEFVLPKKVRKTVWEVDKESCVEPHADRIYIGPHKVPIGVATPGSPELIDVLHKGQNDHNWDMSRTYLYGQQKDHEAKESMRTGADQWLKIMPYIIVLVVVGMIFAPMAYQKLSDRGEIENLRSELKVCYANPTISTSDGGSGKSLTPPAEDQAKPSVNTGPSIKINT